MKVCPVCGGMNMISLNEARRWKRKTGTDVKKSGSTEE